MRIDSSSARPSLRCSRPSPTTWSPGSSSTRSPSTTDGTRTRRGFPSRTTVAVGATSAASRSSVRFARTSWAMPITELATRMARNSASCASPKASVTAPKTSRIRLKTVKTFATTMLLYERLDRCGAAGRAATLRSASSCVSPAGAAVVVTPQVCTRPLPIEPRGRRLGRRSRLSRRPEEAPRDASAPRGARHANVPRSFCVRAKCRRSRDRAPGGVPRRLATRAFRVAEPRFRYESRRAPSKRALYQPAIVEIVTTVPVCGAWMKRLWPM